MCSARLWDGMDDDDDDDGTYIATVCKDNTRILSMVFKSFHVLEPYNINGIIPIYIIPARTRNIMHNDRVGFNNRRISLAINCSVQDDYVPLHPCEYIIIHP